MVLKKKAMLTRVKLQPLSNSEEEGKIEKNLLIVGAGTYALVAFEIASAMRCYKKIAFVDDVKKEAPNGDKVIGTFSEIDRFSSEYSDVSVAIGNPEVRLSLLEKIKSETTFQIATLVSPLAYVAPSAKISEGCVVEPMAVVHTGCKIADGCIISAGAVINHESICLEGVHVDCNATVEGYCLVPAKTKINSGEVFKVRKLNL